MSHYAHVGFSYKPKNSSYNLAAVIFWHALLVWALVAATNKGAFQTLIAPVEVLLINAEVEKPAENIPKPKPHKDTVPKPDIDVPRESPNAPSVTLSHESTPVDTTPVKAKPAPTTDAAMICPTQVTPEIPRQALIKNIQGLIKVEAVVIDGAVKEVHFLSGPRIFQDAVRHAMLQYKCAVKSEAVLATQEFNFHFD